MEKEEGKTEGGVTEAQQEVSVQRLRELEHNKRLRMHCYDG